MVEGVNSCVGAQLLAGIDSQQFFASENGHFYVKNPGFIPKSVQKESKKKTNSYVCFVF